MTNKVAKMGILLGRAIPVLLVLGIAGLAPPAGAATYEEELKAKGAVLQNTDQIKAIFTGNTYEAASSSGKDFVMYMKADGGLLIRVIINSNKTISGDGVWSAENNQFCRKWKNLRDKERRCRNVYKRSDGGIETIVAEDGKFSSKGKFWEGNPKGL